MRYLKVPLGIWSILFLDKFNSSKFCWPLKLSSLIDVILFFDKSKARRGKQSVKIEAGNKFSFNLPNVLRDGTPQNECMPIAGTLDSMIRKISSFFNDWKTAPTWRLCFGFLITITFTSSSNSLIGICFMLAVFHGSWDKKKWKGNFVDFMWKSISNLVIMNFVTSFTYRRIASAHI